MSETKMKYDWDDAKSCYEAGMFYFTNEERNRDKINKGINLLKQACKLGSPEASFMMGKLVWEGYIDIKKTNAKSNSIIKTKTSPTTIARAQRPPINKT